MIRNEISDMRTQISDPLNRERHRTASNTRVNTYNCAGYALECFSWYCPRHGESSWRDYEFDSIEEAIKKTQIAVDTMLEDFPDLRVVQSLAEIRPDEYAILFRISSDGDFHYLKRDRQNHWRHKMGSGYATKIMPTKYIFDEWCHRYDGPIIIMAKRRYAA